MSLNYILGRPESIQDVGNVYPIKIKDYDEFTNCNSVLYYTKNHFHLEDDQELLDQYKTLDMIILGAEGRESIIKDFEKIFSLATNKDVSFTINENNYAFIGDEDCIIHRDNYDQIRNLIMKQNLLFEQKVFKNELVREWAESVLKARSKNSMDISMEDKINTVHIFTGISYNDIANQTIYQLEEDFARISKLIGYETSISLKCAGAEKVKVEYFAESIDMFKNPYDDIFKNSNSKLSNLNKALGNS